MRVTVLDHFEINEKKTNIVKVAITLLQEYLPKYQVCSSHLYIGKYTYFEGPISITKSGPSGNSITSVHFGVLTPQPKDTRIKWLGFPVGEPPKPQVVGGIHLDFKENQAFITEANILVFGRGLKETFLKFAEEFNRDPLWANVGTVNLTVESEFPLNL